jgi:hypothetical protein
MEREPSTRRGGSSGLVGSKAAVTSGTLHIRYHQQEETLKSSVKLGLFALVIAAAAVFGATQFGGVAQAQVPAGTTKTCVPGTTAGTATCTINVPAGGTITSGSTIELTGPAGAEYTNASASGGTPAVSVSPSPAFPTTFLTINCGTAGTTCTGPFTITETLSGAPVGSSVTQTINGAALPAATVTAAAPAAATTTLTLAGCFDIVGAGDPITGAAPVGFLEVSPGEVEFVACVIDVNDTSATPDLVSSGIVSGLDPDIAAVTIASATSNGVSGNVFGGTANVRCGAPNTTDTCDEVIVVIAVRGGPVASPETFTVQITANYVPDNPALNTPAALAARTAFTFRTVTTVTGFVAGDRFVIRCLPSLNPGLQTTFPLAIPGAIDDGDLVGVGILPSALICEAGFLAAGAAANAPFQAVAPGTIEVTSVNGTLLDLRGGLTTNLRIGCGTGPVVSDDLGTINPNTCRGVRFGVIGLGVGFVELRARYEPSSAAAAAGILERETAAEVAFIAPAVSLSLSLNPNPVAVGATGTATLRFNRTAIFAGELLVNPQTGAPLFVNLGTPLNGTVTFQSSNPSVAGFTGNLTAAEQIVTGTVATPGVSVPSQQTAVVRCGVLQPIVVSGLGAVTAANFAGFFGGCSDVAVQYRGNQVGTTDISATFVPDLPGAFGGPVFPAAPGNLQALLGAFGTFSTNTVAQTLQVVGASPVGTQRLVPGCNNVVAPANETVQQVAARVDPAAAVISIWKQVPGTTQFMGAAIGGNVPAGVSNLTNVNALDAIFICVNAAATYRLT